MALNFDGSNDYLTNTSFPWTGTDDITVFVKNFVPSPDQNSYLFSLSTTNSPSTDRVLCHAPWSDGILYWDYGNATAGSGRLSYDYTGNGYLDKWVSIALLATSAPLMKIYLDGTEVATQSSRGSPSNRTAIRLCARGDLGAGNFHKGRLATFAIWNVGLTPSEILRLHYGDSPHEIRADKLVLFYPIWGTGSHEPDWGPGKYHATIGDAPTRYDHPPRTSLRWTLKSGILVPVVTDISVGLTGNGSTAAVGSIIPNRSLALTGNEATGTAGSLSPEFSLSLTGNASTPSPGTLSPAFDISLSGVSATGAVGTVTYSAAGDLNVALSGISGAGAVGTPAPALAVTLAGLSLPAAIGGVAPDRELSPAGNAATGNVGAFGSSRTVPILSIGAAGEVGLVGLLTPPSGITGATGAGSLRGSPAGIGVSDSAGGDGEFDLAATAGTGRAPSGSGSIDDSGGAGVLN